MRTFLTALFAAAMAGVPVSSQSAPRNIDECEKIQAADAYNHCLALFGPIARGHRGLADGVAGGTQEAKAARGFASAEAAPVQSAPRGKRLAIKRGWTKNRWARRAHGQRTKVVSDRGRYGRDSAIAFSVISGRTRMR
ncbi:MAG: hypothetical protein L0Y50_07450 [Beijerinckiaceae bacterium]|nr:hypothetical protein [Beijerinckiaceae bacterium]MCI0736092.1 hypothetical protein [Beijerinckiaceae bacterium]